MKKTKLIGLGLASLVLLTGCGTIPTTKDGKEAIVTINKDEKHNITADDLYQVLKDKYGFDEVISMIDTYIYETEFKDYKKTAKDYANIYLKGIKNSFDTNEEFLNAIKKNTDYRTEEEYLNSIYLSYLQKHAIEEYAKSQVTDKQIEKYYNDDVKESIEVYHILITPDVKDSMSETEKTKTKDKAMKEAEDILKEINSSSNKFDTFKKLAKEKSDDEDTKKDGGKLGSINEFTLSSQYDELVDAAYSIKDGEVYAKVVTTELGYHVVYRNKTNDKVKLDDVKDKIKDKLAEQVMASDQNFAVNTFKYYHKLYNLNIVDSELESAYRTYLNNLMKTSTEKKDQ